MFQHFKKRIEQIYSQKIYFFLLALLLWTPFPLNAENFSDKIVSFDSLHYKWGDSPIDKTGKLEWIKNDYQYSKWKTTKLLFNPPGRSGHNFVWFKFKMPDIKFKDPIIFLTYIYNSFELYSDNEMIYRYRQLEPGPVYGEKGYGCHIVPIGKEHRGKTISLRVFSDYSHIGIIRSPRIGSRYSLLRSFIFSDMEKLIITMISGFIGIVSLVSFMFFRKQKSFLSLALISISVSALSFIFTDIKGFMFSEINEIYWLLSTFIFPIGVLSFFDSVFGSGYKSIIRRIWQILIIYTIFITPIIYYDFVTSQQARIILGFFLVLGIIFMIVRNIQLIKQGNRNSKIFLVGLVILTITAIVDYFITISFTSEIASKINMNPMMSSGYLFFIIFLIVILVFRFFEVYRNLEIAKQRIEGYSDNLQKMVESRTLELRKITKELESERNKLKNRNEIMVKDLDMARKIQQDLIPAENPSNYISSLYMPMEQVGGDFYDFIFFREKNKIGIFLSDVSGHGAAAAFITSMLKTILLQSGERKSNPSELLYYMNEILYKQTSGNFITAFYGIYNRTEKSFLYCNAGHPPPLIITNKVTKIKNIPSIALAMFGNDYLTANNKTFVNLEINLPESSKILLYTDGFTETRKLQGSDFFEYNNMNDVLLQNRNLSGKEFLNNIYNELLHYRKADTFEDDICLVCLDV